MSLDEESRRVVLDFLGYHLGYKVEQVSDLEKLSAADLLALLGRVKSAALPYVLQLLKEAPSSAGLFQKLMGDHDPELWPLAQAFFERYQTVMMEEVLEDYNALLIYLPQESWNDLAFLQSREVFFLRQTMADIIDFLDCYFKDIPDFMPGEEKQAWNWFFNRVVLG